jgi:hypothetical protein
VDPSLLSIIGDGEIWKKDGYWYMGLNMTDSCHLFWWLDAVGIPIPVTLIQINMR